MHKKNENRTPTSIDGSNPGGGMSRFGGFSRRTLALCGLLSAATGCEAFMQKPLCPALDTCGGDFPYGDWKLKPGGSSCTEDLHVPLSDLRLIGADVTAARVPPPEPALADWCVNLVANGGKNIQARAAAFYTDSPHIGSASIRFKDDGTYAAGMAMTGNFQFDFPAFCMRAFAAMDGRPADPEDNPDGPGVDVCKQLEVPLRKSGAGEGTYPNTTCEKNEADPGGCICKFDMTSVSGVEGPFYQTGSSTITALSPTNFPVKVNYCRKGNRLQLTGADGQYLFNRRGLRTLDLELDTEATNN
jgi:hypothetical protein